MLDLQKKTTKKKTVKQKSHIGPQITAFVCINMDKHTVLTGKRAYKHFNNHQTDILPNMFIKTDQKYYKFFIKRKRCNTAVLQLEMYPSVVFKVKTPHVQRNINKRTRICCKMNEIRTTFKHFEYIKSEKKEQGKHLQALQRGI